MLYGNNSSIKSAYNNASPTAFQNNEKLNKLGQEIEELQNQYNALVIQLGEKASNSELASEIAEAKTEIKTSISRNVNTDELGAGNASIVNLSVGDTKVTNDKVVTETVEVKDVKPNSIIFTADSDLSTYINSNEYASISHPGIYYFVKSDKNAIVKYTGEDAVVIVTSDGSFINYTYNSNGLLIKPTGGAQLYSITERELPVISAGNLTNPVTARKGTTVLGDFYASLTNTHFDSLNVTSFSANSITAGNISSDTIYSGANVKIDGANNAVCAPIGKFTNAEVSNNAYIAELRAPQIDTFSEEDYAVATIPNIDELHAIRIPRTNGEWHIQLGKGNNIKLLLTVVKTGKASVITYKRFHASAFVKVEYYEDSIYLFTRYTGNVYFANVSMEGGDTSISTYSEDDLPYSEPGYTININTEDGVITFPVNITQDVLICGNLNVCGTAVFHDFAANSIATKHYSTSNVVYPVFVKHDNNVQGAEELYTNSFITFIPDNGYIEAECIKTNKKAWTKCECVTECIRTPNIYNGPTLTSQELTELPDDSLVIYTDEE